MPGVVAPRAVIDAGTPATWSTNTGLTPGTQYSYALFAQDGGHVCSGAPSRGSPAGARWSGPSRPASPSKA